LTNSGLIDPTGALTGAPAVAPSYAELQESVLLLRATITELSESLAISNSEAEMFKRQSADLALQLDALGFADLQANPEKLEGRVISAVRELRRVQEENDALRAQLVTLIESIVAVTAMSELEPGLRADIEKEMRQANSLLGPNPGIAEAPAVEPTLTDAMIVDVKNDLGLIVANVGNRQDVRIGMPFAVLRGREIIGSVLIIDVRERISGAIIQNLVSENQTIQVGDRLRVETRR